MKITWYGTASLVVEAGNTVLVFDPYLKDLPKKRESEELKNKRKDVFSKQQNVLITHGHFDHLASVKPIYGDKPCKIYVTNTPYKTLKKKKFLTEKMQEISTGDTLYFDGVSVRALRGRHVKFIGSDIVKTIFREIRYFPRTIRLGLDFFKYPENDETMVYEIEAEGKVIQVMGSAGLLDDIEYTHGADVLILPHQGRRDIDEHNKRIVEKLCPKRVLLDHYDDAFPPFSKDIPVDGFCEQMSEKIPTEKLVEGKPVVV